MSDSLSKEKHSKRLHKEESAIKKQQKIAMQHGLTKSEVEREPHRFAKHHAMDCGQPGCVLCGNPRHNGWYKSERLTAQERRLFQDLDQQRDKHSNGLNNDQE